MFHLLTSHRISAKKITTHQKDTNVECKELDHSCSRASTENLGRRNGGLLEADYAWKDVDREGTKITEFSKIIEDSSGDISMKRQTTNVTKICKRKTPRELLAELKAKADVMANCFSGELLLEMLDAAKDGNYEKIKNLARAERQKAEIVLQKRKDTRAAIQKPLVDKEAQDRRFLERIMSSELPPDSSITLS
jgi:hypothetical protein